MSLRAPSLCRFAVGILVLSAVASAQAQLAAKSPFMAPQSAAANTPTAGAPLEFRALIETAEGVQFRIFDPAKKTGTWVKLNERNAEFDVLIKQHDDSQKIPTLTIEHQGRTLTLAMREAKIVSSGSAAQAMPPPPMPQPANVPPAVTQAVVLNPTPADEQRRLEAVAAEVARRRALREQATQQISQGGTPQVAVPPPQPQAQPQGQRNFQPPPGGQNTQRR
jgi:hypothetical protein